MPNMFLACRDDHWIIRKAGAVGRYLDRSFRNTAKLDNTLGNEVRVDFGFFRYRVKEQMQSDKARSFHIPMGLFGLGLQINGISKTGPWNMGLYLGPNFFRKSVLGTEYLLFTLLDHYFDLLRVCMVL